MELDEDFSSLAPFPLRGDSEKGGEPGGVQSGEWGRCRLPETSGIGGSPGGLFRKDP